MRMWEASELEINEAHWQLTVLLFELLLSAYVVWYVCTYELMTVNVTSSIAVNHSFYFHDCEGIVDDCSMQCESEK